MARVLARIKHHQLLAGVLTMLRYEVRVGVVASITQISGRNHD
ncbi:hypothetical protein ART_3539 [Arthrobacter sp. PAMC 25486]|nr:hypothetical protein ART_3539 [Arthrobacter sp. PAMC 25486]